MYKGQTVPKMNTEQALPHLNRRNVHEDSSPYEVLAVFQTIPKVLADQSGWLFLTYPFERL